MITDRNTAHAVGRKADGHSLVKRVRSACHLQNGRSRGIEQVRDGGVIKALIKKKSLVQNSLEIPGSIIITKVEGSGAEVVGKVSDVVCRATQAIRRSHVKDRIRLCDHHCSKCPHTIRHRQTRVEIVCIPRIVPGVGKAIRPIKAEPSRISIALKHQSCETHLAAIPFQPATHGHIGRVQGGKSRGEHNAIQTVHAHCPVVRFKPGKLAPNATRGTRNRTQGGIGSILRTAQTSGVRSGIRNIRWEG